MRTGSRKTTAPGPKARGRFSQSSVICRLQWAGAAGRLTKPGEWDTIAKDSNAARRGRRESRFIYAHVAQLDRAVAS